MPTYDYICNQCAETNGEESATFETRYSFSATDDEIKECTICPYCDGSNVTKLISGAIHVNVKQTLKGEAWVEYKKKNAAAFQRDLNLHTLQNNDPYATMREPGEVQHMEDQLKAARKKKPNRKYYT